MKPFKVEKLPIQYNLDKELIMLISEANLKYGEYKSNLKNSQFDSRFFLDSIILSESLKSTQIEGAQISQDDMYYLKYMPKTDDNLEIQNLKKVIDYAKNYLKENNFKVLTMQEFNDWMDGKIEFDQKSVLITIDDGAAGTFDLLPAILEEYQMPATLFLISGWWPVSRYSSSSYLEIESHGHDLHHNHYCINDRCGYKTLLLSKEELKADLNTSIKTIGSQLAFCYPFYQTNTTLVEAVKESGFSLAFVGGNKKATRKSNKYYVPRYIIYKNTSLASFKNMVN